jgi:hypothetical protein
MIFLDLLVWICSSALSWILAPVGSLQIYILLTPNVLLDVVLGIPDSKLKVLPNDVVLGSLQIYILLTPNVLLDVVLGIPDSYFFLPAVLLGSCPWHFAISGRFCNPSSGG